MSHLTPSSRLKTKSDTFYVPVPNGGVYFRNHVGSFRMEGEMIDRWIEKLVPMFNGVGTLGELTDGLPDAHRSRVYEIAEVLHQKGFVQDVSRDVPHQLADEALRTYASQIAFLESFGDSAAYRFQMYRQHRVLAVGAGPMFLSLVSALLETGLPKLHMWITDSVPTNRQRLAELIDHARKTDSDVEAEIVNPAMEGAGAWREAIRPYQTVLYVSPECDPRELLLLEQVCREENKQLLPAVCLHQAGIAGPLVDSGAEGGWESAWRRLHDSAVNKDRALHSFSAPAGALLANVIVFELFKFVTGVTGTELRNSMYVLDLETLEGGWHPFLPHPLSNGRINVSVETNRNLDRWFHKSSANQPSNKMLVYVGQLTSAQTGIIHAWDEGDLRQLPLSQCRVQAVDPLSEPPAPARLLPEVVCNGLTHEEARRESGLAGIEAYVSRLAEVLVSSEEIVGVGVGETAAEGMTRGLQSYLAQKLARQVRGEETLVARVQLRHVEDVRCRFYLQSLRTLQGEVTIGRGEDVSGFPVLWVGARDCWYGGIGLNPTLALRKALQAALLSAQNQSGRPPHVPEPLSLRLKQDPPVIVDIPAVNETSQQDALQDALHVVERNGEQLFVVDLAVESFLREVPEAVVGVYLRKGESS